MAALIWQARQPKSVRPATPCLEIVRVIRVAQQVHHQLVGGILDRLQQFLVGGIEMGVKAEEDGQVRVLARFTAR